RRERVAVFVVREVLEQHATDALHDTARDLAFDDTRIDHRAAVFADDVTQQRDATRLDVDFARAHVRRVHPDRSRDRGIAGGRFEPGRYAGRKRVGLVVRSGGDLGERNADRRRAAHVGATLRDLDVVDGGFELVRGDRADALAQYRRGL